MCGVAAASLVVAGISTAVGMAAQYQQQQAQEKAAKNAASYNAQMAENEASLQQQLAQNEIAKGAAERERQQRSAARQMGAMRAGIGASGFQMDSGSMVSLLSESAEEHQYDSNIIASNAAQAAWQHQVAGNSALNSKAFAQYQGANASGGRLGTYLGMGGSLLGGIGTGIGQYSALQQTQAPGAGDKYWDRALGQYVSKPVRH